MKVLTKMLENYLEKAEESKKKNEQKQAEEVPISADGAVSTLNTMDGL